jgi:hypothetical protein
LAATRCGRRNDAYRAAVKAMEVTCAGALTPIPPHVFRFLDRYRVVEPATFGGSASRSHVIALMIWRCLRDYQLQSLGYRSRAVRPHRGGLRLASARERPYGLWPSQELHTAKLNRIPGYDRGFLSQISVCPCIGCGILRSILESRSDAAMKGSYLILEMS